MGWWFIEHMAHDPDKWHTQMATAYGPGAGNTYPVNTKMVRGMEAGVWGGWKVLATEDKAFIDRGLAPLDWNTAVIPGAYWVHPDYQVGQSNSAVLDIGMYPYGQLEVINSQNGGAVSHIYRTHRGEIAIRGSYSGATWAPWRQVATMDLVAPAKYGIGEYVDASHTITLNATSTKTGFFYYANTDPNRPDSGDGQVLVQSFNNTSIKETAFSWTGLIYQRQYSSSMWSEWKRIATADNVTNVTVLTGTIADGGTIPLPSGYTQDQCKWMVSINHIYNSQEASYTDCRADANRVVYVKNTIQTTGGIANYMIIGVK